MRLHHKAALLFALAVLVHPSRASLCSAFVLELSLTGKTVQAQVSLAPGVKPPTGKVNDKVISDVLRGEKEDWSSQFVDVHP